MTEFASGNQHAFETLYKRYKGATYRYFLRQLDRTSAADCHQELWLKIIKTKKRYKSRGKFSGYLFQLAHTTTMDHFRRHTAKEGNWQDLQPENLITDGQIDALEQAQTAKKLTTLIRALPVAQRSALIMKAESGMSLKDIAKACDASEEGIKSRLRYAVAKLRTGMQES